MATDGATGPGGASPADAALLRRTRLRLMAWSGGLTAVVLLVLGTSVYLAVAGALASNNSDLLARRAVQLGRFIQERGLPSEGRGLGITFGGEATGTLALVVRPDGSVAGAGPSGSISGLPDTAGVDAAIAGGSSVRDLRVDDLDVRAYSLAVPALDGTYVVQVIGERASEVRLLTALLLVLVGGGLVALALATGLGFVYAGRALVPIRASMARRDAALRRQREFTANASHELRAPLTVVRASVADLRRNASEPVRDVGTALDDIDVEVVHLTALVDDLLLLARTDSGAVELVRELVDLADIAAEVAGTIGPVAGEREVRVVLDPRPAQMDGDPLRLRQLATILVDNAVAHSPAGGLVSVTVRPDGDLVTLIVDDEGPGIRAEDLPHVFERFWRADDAPPGGTGLGLAIAAWIVEGHGGTIEASNRPDRGARLAVRMPSALPQPA
ncbi:MAG: HAMP domain-containing histidine kinase [Chloroflexi bacterium]|nr:HAMP domain-containing histidine kinase [Chloroflexota bacterium]